MQVTVINMQLLPDAMQGAKALLVGFPGGKICSEQHVPGYLKAVGVSVIIASVPAATADVVSTAVASE
jgi:hypothetical protein